MKSVAILFAAVIFSVAQTAAAQSFTVVSSSPEQGKTSVPLQTVVRFTFSAEVDVNTDWNTAFLPEPRDSIRFDRVALLLDTKGRPAVVEYNVTQTPNTDFTWTVYSVKSVDGISMTEPYTLHYATGMDIGSHDVTGTIEASAAKTDVLTGAERLSLGNIAKALVAAGRGTLLFGSEEIPPLPSPDAGMDADAVPGRAGKTFQVTIANSRFSSSHTQVVLLQKFSTAESEWSVRTATAINGSAGPFGISYVRDGTYWPVAVRYTDDTNTAIEALGYYDPDGDGDPDSVRVAGSDISGVAISMHSFPLVTARLNLETARDSAAHYAADQALLMIQAGDGARPDGSAYQWTYRFMSSTMDLLTTVSIDPLFVHVDTTAVPPYMKSMAPISDSFIDSDQATQVAQENGGTDFLRPYRPSNVVTVLEAGNLYWATTTSASDMFWRVRYIGFTSNENKSFSILVDLRDGLVITDVESVPDIADTFGLDQNYPNPFTSETAIRIYMPVSARVSLTVYNVLGQEVARLLSDAPLAAGERVIPWDARNVPSGVYLCRMEVRDAGVRYQSTRRMTVVR